MTRLVSTDTISAGLAASLADAEDIFVLPGVTLGSSGATGIQASFDSHSLLIGGTVFGAVNGIELGTLASKLLDIDSDIHIGPQGAVTAGLIGIQTQGGGISVTNEGTVHGGERGLSHLGNVLQVINLGTISGTDDGLFIRGTGNRVENHGVIASQGDGIYAMVDTTLPVAVDSSILVENFGTISGQAAAFRAIAMGEAKVFTSTILNHGVIAGAVVFADGNDLYD